MSLLARFGIETKEQNNENNIGKDDIKSNSQVVMKNEDEDLVRIQEILLKLELINLSHDKMEHLSNSIAEFKQKLNVILDEKVSFVEWNFDVTTDLYDKRMNYLLKLSYLLEELITFSKIYFYFEDIHTFTNQNVNQYNIEIQKEKLLNLELQIVSYHDKNQDLDDELHRLLYQAIYNFLKKEAELCGKRDLYTRLTPISQLEIKKIFLEEVLEKSQWNFKLREYINTNNIQSMELDYDILPLLSIGKFIESDPKDSPVSTNQNETIKNDIVYEVEKLLSSEKNREGDCISLYDILMLLNKTSEEYWKMKKYYTELIWVTYRSKAYHDIEFEQFNYLRKWLILSIEGCIKFNKIILSKKNGDLYIVKSDYDTQDLLLILGDELSKFYDELLKYSDFCTQQNLGISSINSNFFISITDNEIIVSHNGRLGSDFGLKKFIHQDRWEYQCNSNNTISVVKGNEEELFKSIFVKIEDCPEWTRSILSQTRMDQLLNKRQNPQKKLGMIQKLFSFGKN